MRTQIFKLHEAAEPVLTALQRAEDFINIQQAATLLGQNELVAFPTETVYGLGANAFSDEAVAKIFLAKGRPSDNPLIVHIGRKEDLRRVALSWPPSAEVLMNRFWPGPLTLVLPRRLEITPRVSAGLATVAVRIPDHPVALKLLRAVGLPIAAPSANRSGRPSPTRPEHVLEDLEGAIAALIDAGATREGLESTVLDLSGAQPVILRPGSVTREMLKVYLPDLQENVMSDGTLIQPPAPGMKYTHYAPKAPMNLYLGGYEATRSRILTDLDMWQRTGRRVALLTPGQLPGAERADLFIELGRPEHGSSDPDMDPLNYVSANLYSALRLCDAERVGIILVQGVPAVGLGEAIVNRLSKAAREIVRLEEVD